MLATQKPLLSSNIVKKKIDSRRLWFSSERTRPFFACSSVLACKTGQYPLPLLSQPGNDSLLRVAAAPGSAERCCRRGEAAGCFSCRPEVRDPPGTAAAAVPPAAGRDADSGGRWGRLQRWQSVIPPSKCVKLARPHPPASSYISGRRPRCSASLSRVIFGRGRRMLTAANWQVAGVLAGGEAPAGASPGGGRGGAQPAPAPAPLGRRAPAGGPPGAERDRLRPRGDRPSRSPTLRQPAAGARLCFSPPARKAAWGAAAPHGSWPPPWRGPPSRCWRCRRRPTRTSGRRAAGGCGGPRHFSRVSATTCPTSCRAFCPPSTSATARAAPWWSAATADTSARRPSRSSSKWPRPTG